MGVNPRTRHRVCFAPQVKPDWFIREQGVVFSREEGGGGGCCPCLGLVLFVLVLCASFSFHAPSCLELPSTSG